MRSAESVAVAHVARVGMLVDAVFADPRAHLTALPFRVEGLLEDARPLRLLVVVGGLRAGRGKVPLSASTASTPPQHY